MLLRDSPAKLSAPAMRFWWIGPCWLWVERRWWSGVFLLAAVAEAARDCGQLNWMPVRVEGVVVGQNRGMRLGKNEWANFLAATPLTSACVGKASSSSSRLPRVTINFHSRSHGAPDVARAVTMLHDFSHPHHHPHSHPPLFSCALTTPQQTLSATQSRRVYTLDPLTPSMES